MTTRPNRDQIAGVDEAGRGPLSGPVVAAAVILPNTPRIEGLADSKVLSADRRLKLYAEIMMHCKVGVAAQSASDIDRENIHRATLLAMAAAIGALPAPPRLALFDGKFVPPGQPFSCEAIVRGDSKEPAISAASIVAKVVRDRAMTLLDEQFPGYGFARHMGYPTPQHLEALDRLGPTPHHRLSFKPVRQALEKRAALPPDHSSASPC